MLQRQLMHVRPFGERQKAASTTSIARSNESLIAPDKRAMVATMAMVITPRTTVYSAIVWPPSALILIIFSIDIVTTLFFAFFTCLTYVSGTGTRGPR